jgi:hypothetical protein
MTDGPPAGGYRVAVDGLPPKGTHISRADVADFMRGEAVRPYRSISRRGERYQCSGRSSPFQNIQRQSSRGCRKPVPMAYGSRSVLSRSNTQTIPAYEVTASLRLSGLRSFAIGKHRELHDRQRLRRARLLVRGRYVLEKARPWDRRCNLTIPAASDFDTGCTCQSDKCSVV